MADNGVLTFTERSAAPNSPSTGKLNIYAKTDGLLYYQDENGVETLIGGIDPTYTHSNYIPLATALASASWAGGGRSTTAKTLIDLSSVFGVPSGVKAVHVFVRLNDSASGSGNYYMILSPNNTAGSGIFFQPGDVNDKQRYAHANVTCDSNGDIYYQISASGSSTMDVLLQINGYWI